MHSSNRVSQTMTQAGDWTDELSCPPGLADVSISGSFVGSVSILKSLDGGTTWGVAHVCAGADEALVETGSGCLLKAGFETGDYTSGQAVVILAAEAI